MTEKNEQPSFDVSGSQKGASRTARVLAFSTTGLFFLAICYTLYIAQDILIPVTAAVILALLLQPASRLLRRAKIPEAIAAGIVVFAPFAVLTVGIVFLADPATKWISGMPDIVAEVQEKIKKPIEEIKDAKEAVEEIVDETQSSAAGKAAGKIGKLVKQDTAPQRGHNKPSRLTLVEVLTQTFVVLSDVAWGAVIIFVLLYFLLATGSLLRENIILALPTLRDKKQALQVTSDVQHGVSDYLLTVILINLGLGVAIGIAMYVIELPNPALWGTMAALLNFIPYLGAIAGSVVVTIVGLVTFTMPVEALIAPCVYIMINSLEAYLVTPAILSRRLTINPIAVFLSVIFWGWIWGVPGALMAVPILASLKMVCNATDRLSLISQFLSGRRRDDERSSSVRTSSCKAKKNRLNRSSRAGHK